MQNRKITRVIMILLICLVTVVGCSLQTGLPEPKVPVASRIFDSSGRLITTIGNYYRIPVKQDEISPYMKQAVVAVEDERFNEHYGVDPVGIIRAAYRNLRAQKVVEGGSTITQQLAKNLYLTHQRTFTRKIKEMYYALLLERNYTKEEILNKYLNTVYFGEGCYGVEAAANKFFDKQSKELTLPESAMLAGFVKAPSFYSNPENIEKTRERQRIVLHRMQQLNYITMHEMQQAVNAEVEVLPVLEPASKAGYFVAELIEKLEEKLPGGKDELYTGGLKIESTLDLDKQQVAEKVVNEKLKNKEGLQAALVAMNPANGHVVAMVGGGDYSQTQYNRALAQRQPGSAFKPFVYAAALEHGYTAASTFYCGPVEFNKAGREESYKPTDYKEDYHNRHFTLKEALKISDNVVAVQLNVQIGPRTVADLARRMGITSKLDPYESLALGTSEVTPLEMAQAYAALANGGIGVEPIYFTRVLDRDGHVIATRRSKLTRVLDENHAFIITDMLKSVLEPEGTAGHLVINRPAAGKTGTTDEYHDAWFVGYTMELSAAVYVGYDKDNEEKAQVVGTGGTTAGPIWEKFINDTMKNESIKEFKQPKDIVFKEVCARDGLLATPASTDIIKVAFEKGTEPIAYCTGDINWEYLPKEIDEQVDEQKAIFSIPWEEIIPFTFD
ncbi:MAG: PBP1A family penicillin-binding protein [Firmicutes bacterium]|nr:PBP1A family penicillin-binding protein [Bacillota bacterium]